MLHASNETDFQCSEVTEPEKNYHQKFS